MIRTVSALLLGFCASLGAQTAQGLLVSNTQSTGYFDVANVTGLGPQSITVEAWVTYDETTITPVGNAWPTILRKNVAPGGEEYFLRVNAGSTGNRVLTWKVVTAGGAVNVNWNFAAGELLNLTHVAGVWDAVAGEARLVVNGTTVATATGTGPLVDNGGALRVGGGDPSVPENWNGIIDELRVWSVPLGDAQIAASMFNQVLTATNLVASWILEGDALDYTGNGHDGVLVQPATFTPVTLPQPTFQVNSAACSLDIEGVSSSIFAPGVVKRCPGQVANFNLGGTPGPWDALLTVGASAVPDTSGALAPWRVNVDLSDPTLTFLNGLAFSPANLLPTVSLPVATPVAALTVQLVVIDPAQPLALAFSSVATLEPDPTGLSSTVAGPTADDTPLGPIDVTAAPLFGSPVVFYNAIYTDIYVNPNGRVSFTGGDTDFSATVAEFLLDPPSLGVWSDLSPNVGGSVTIGVDCTNLLRVRWDQVPYFGQAAGTATNSFEIVYDPITTFWSLENLTGVSTNATIDILVGACPGNLAPGPATDPGPQDFTQGAAPVGTGSDAIYEFGTVSNFGLPGGVLGGAGPIYPVSIITFQPNGSGYDWFSL